MCKNTPKNIIRNIIFLCLVACLCITFIIVGTVRVVAYKNKHIVSTAANITNSSCSSVVIIMNDNTQLVQNNCWMNLTYKINRTNQTHNFSYNKTLVSKLSDGDQYGIYYIDTDSLTPFLDKPTINDEGTWMMLSGIFIFLLFLACRPPILIELITYIKHGSEINNYHRISGQL